MARTVVVEVTAADIERGEKRDQCLCPVALACKRAGIVNPEVENYSIYVGGRYIDLPDEATQFIVDFDRNREVAPLTFTVELP